MWQVERIRRSKHEPRGRAPIAAGPRIKCIEHDAIEEEKQRETNWQSSLVQRKREKEREIKKKEFQENFASGALVRWTELEQPDGRERGCIDVVRREGRVRG